ncbi:MAG: DUF2889 domain-containing protein [Rhodospirillales bacterium]|nr:DUF2889 domain-containing protein [Rhodospirillales bacterium]
MPLSKPGGRELLHRREITINGYRRTDGRFDIEAHLVDTKSYSFPSEDRGEIPAGEPLHEMWVRLRVDEDLVIEESEAVTEYGPFAICPDAAPNFSRLAGLRIGRGFLRAAMERVGGVAGCTHLRELLQQIGTTAFQTLYAVRVRKDAARTAGGQAPRMLNTCYAYASDGPVVRRRWPQFHTGPGARAEAAAGED